MSDERDSEIEDYLRAHDPFEQPPLCSCGERVGDWKVLAFLGRGGTSEVYRAENVVTGLVAALKVLVRSDDRARMRFKREVQLVADMRSAAFPKFYGAGESGGHLYLAEELLEPVSLPSQDSAVAQFIMGVCVGVDELHRQGFVHRDIKPGNVMVRPSTGESVLIDMGLAKGCEDTSQTHDETLSVIDGRAVGVGTPGFSAPEQFIGGRTSIAADIHAIGMLANACFEGKPPRAWTTIIRCSTSSIPDQRYATVTELVQAVRRRHAGRNWFVGSLVVGCVILTTVLCWRFCEDAPQQVPQTDRDISRQSIEEKPSGSSIPGVKTESADVGCAQQTDLAISQRIEEVHSRQTDKEQSEKDKLLEAIWEAHHDPPTHHVTEDVPPVKPKPETMKLEEKPRSESAMRLLELGETAREDGKIFTQIALDGRDVRIQGDIHLERPQRIVIDGPGRIVASISGVKDVKIELGKRAALINLTDKPYPQSGIRYILHGACYLNFKNLDAPADSKNIWVDDLRGTGRPLIRFRGIPDSYDEAAKEQKKIAIELMKKGQLDWI